MVRNTITTTTMAIITPITTITRQRMTRSRQPAICRQRRLDSIAAHAHNGTPFFIEEQY
jgi:hypothetical protein